MSRGMWWWWIPPIIMIAYIFMTPVHDLDGDGPLRESATAARLTSMSRAATIPVGPRSPVTNDPRIRLPGVKTYKGAIYDALVEMIAELELPPGSRLVEADLVSRFNVSKTPIREAFLQLE